MRITLATASKSISGSVTAGGVLVHDLLVIPSAKFTLVGEKDPACQTVPVLTSIQLQSYPSSLAERTLRRQIPKVGAQCVNHARWDLCGGCSAMGIPTAIAHF
jgi:hypothetical protein